MTYTAQTRIGDIVLDLPATMRVFEQRSIDYCCGGHRSLAEACAQAGQDVQDVLAGLAQVQAAPAAAEDPAALAAAGPAAMIDHIEATHHAFTRSELDRVAPLMDKVARVHGEHHPELIAVRERLQALRDDLLPHLDKEERILFPYIRALAGGAGGTEACFGTVRGPIAVMQAEHEAAGDLLRDLRTLTHDYALPEDACGSYRSLYLGLEALEQDLHRHIYLESHLLFPAAVDLEARQG